MLNQAPLALTLVSHTPSLLRRPTFGKLLSVFKSESWRKSTVNLGSTDPSIDGEVTQSTGSGGTSGSLGSGGSGGGSGGSGGQIQNVSQDFN